MQAFTHTTTSSPHRFQELDALRGIAAFGVMLFHFTINANKLLLGWQFRFGVTGVDLFFMISGFVILLSASKANSVREFAIARFVRLYPTFWICAFVTFLFKKYDEPENTGTKELLANATMAPNFFGVEYLDGSYWTLVIELTFYFWMAAIMRSGSVKYIAESGLIVLTAIISFHLNSIQYPDFYQFIIQKIQIVNHFPLFYSGIIFYYIKKSGWSFKHAVYLVTSATASFYLHDKGGHSRDFLSLNEHCLIITAFHLLFLLFVSDRLEFLKIRALIFLGKISYCLYLIHQYIGLRIIEWLGKFGNLNIYPALFITISLCMTFAWVITFRIEMPAVCFLKSKMQLSTPVCKKQDSIKKLESLLTSKQK
ncbi:acyltransferase family protein [Dyadobacter aurulentus]|uniref:acyltransferase family protein n=1 Tax=Dyadobacter sp. UC 10 TaxID=2605428 RepID=UPI0011F16EDB|nr:acyltransferase [Dyadobacter sp. UC 10]KAA0992190.1 acyltransferase [Dyadobacter sp. UC 10]